jgi:4-hydroxy-tetrahydrodipicolinate reductase
MTRIIIHGCRGQMGQAVAAAAAAAADIEVAAGVDPAEGPAGTAFPVSATLAECSVQADAVVDFSSPKALPGLLEAAVARRTPVIVATTGLSAEDKALAVQASRTIPVFVSANMSLGIALVSELAQKAATVLGESFDIEIVEKHHNLKKDAPSGTALLLADAINEVFLKSKNYVYGRQGRNALRERSEVGIHAVRAGTIVGEHEVIFAGKDELVELRHAIASRQIFALGALQAARYLTGKPPGLYGMKDMINAASAVTRLYVSEDEALVTLYRVPQLPEALSKVFRRIGEANIMIDMISQTAPVEGQVNVSFTLLRQDAEAAGAILRSLEESVGTLEIKVMREITKIAVEGPGMETQSGVAARVFETLAARKIKIQSVTTSETKIALIIDRQDRPEAVAAIKQAFGL